jgi:hypothetical protein
MALTEKYVSALAGGSGDGNSAGSAYTFDQMLTEINSVSGTGGQGKRYNVKADGVYARATYDSLWGATGTATSPVYIRGYKTTIGDGYLGRDASGALITTNLPAINYTDYRFELGQRMVLESMNMSYTATGAGGDLFVQTNHFSAILGCRFSTARTNTDTRLGGFGGDYVLNFENDYFLTATSGPNTDMCFTNNAGVRIDSCRIICSSTTMRSGLRCDSGTVVYGTLIKGAGGGAGIYFADSRPCYIRNCTVTNWQDGVFWNTTTPDQLSWIAGNMLTDNSRYGINLSTGTQWCGIIGPNRVRDNVSGDTNSATLDWANAGRILPLVTTDTGGPETDYTNASGNDYSLIATSPAKDANRPKNSDLGAFGLPTTTGGGGTSVFNPLGQFIIRPALQE